MDWGSKPKEYILINVNNLSLALEYILRNVNNLSLALEYILRNVNYLSLALEYILGNVNHINQFVLIYTPYTPWHFSKKNGNSGVIESPRGQQIS